MWHRTTLIGAAVTALGAVGYGVGMVVAYPGRAFSITAVMIGVTLLSLGGARRMWNS